MKTLKGPGIFLAQFAGDAAPFNSFDAICGWAASLGYRGVQVPSWDARLFDLGKASESKDYCDEITGVAAGQLGRGGFDSTSSSPIVIMMPFSSMSPGSSGLSDTATISSCFGPS